MISFEDILPQKPPFVFLDNISQIDEKNTTGSKFYGSDFSFYDEINDHRYVPTGIILESLMQCGGAGAKMLNLTGNAPLVVASIDKVKTRKLIRIPNLVEVKVENLRIRSKVLYQQGSAYLNGKIFLSARWHCLAIFNSSQ